MQMPPLCPVAASAPISGTGDVDADSSKAFIPVLLGAALTPA